MKNTSLYIRSGSRLEALAKRAKEEGKGFSEAVELELEMYERLKELIKKDGFLPVKEETK